MKLTDAQKEEAVLHSAVILLLARYGQWPKVVQNFGALMDRFGLDGLGVLMYGIADTVVIYQEAIPRDGGFLMPEWFDADTGQPETADQVSRPDVRWAGRFIAARGSRDQAACEALVRSCKTSEEFGNNVVTLIEVAAGTLNALGAPGGPR